jgi:serine/threonine-protein kinase RsbW
MGKTFKRDIRSLEKVFGFIDEFAARENIGDSVRRSLYLAVDELFTNMIKYHPANANDITIVLERVADEMTVKLVDRDVEPFDIMEAKDPNLLASLDERKPGGLGIYLTKNVVDNIKYEYRDRTSIITLTKRLRRNDVSHPHE